MGFDIEAENGSEISTYMGAFRMLTEQGYDWFELIDAYDCYGGVSGNGNEKAIKLSNLEKALEEINIFKNTKLSSEGRDEFTHRKPMLIEFMKDCISWCKINKKNEIKVYFG
jgi:hypothetical protein